jgi:hypothetical protein
MFVSICRHKNFTSAVGCKNVAVEELALMQNLPRKQRTGALNTVLGWVPSHYAI